MDAWNAYAYISVETWIRLSIKWIRTEYSSFMIELDTTILRFKHLPFHDKFFVLNFHWKSFSFLLQSHFFILSFTLVDLSYEAFSDFFGGIDCKFFASAATALPLCSFRVFASNYCYLWSKLRGNGNEARWCVFQL